MKKILLITITIILLSTTLKGQWANKWESATLTTGVVSGWVAFKQNGDQWEERFYEINATSFIVYSGQFSNNSNYTYNFTAEEQTAGNQIYSVGYDLTGDGIVEFYVLSYYGSSDNYREAFKVIDITTGSTLFEMNNASYYYSYPVIWDIDNDGMLECTFTRSDYPDYNGYTYEVYDTGAPTSAKIGEYVQLNYSLEQNYPNPFNPSTIIEYSVPEADYIDIKIYNINGELVKNLFSGNVNPGSYKIKWNGRNEFGNRVASGTYFYQLSAKGKTISKKMLLIK